MTPTQTILLEHLKAHSGKEFSPLALMESLEMLDESFVRRTLKALHADGLIQKRMDGKHAYYSHQTDPQAKPQQAHHRCPKCKRQVKSGHRCSCDTQAKGNPVERIKGLLLQAATFPSGLTALASRIGYAGVTTEIRTAMEELVAEGKMQTLPAPKTRGNSVKTLYVVTK